MACSVGSMVKGGGSEFLGLVNAPLDAATDPSGLGFLQSRTILHRSEHPKQPFSCFFVGVASADLVDADSGSGETDGLKLRLPEIALDVRRLPVPIGIDVAP